MKSRLLGIGAGAAVALSTSLYADAQPEKPNILFVMVDDLAPDAVFSDRFPFLKTPNVDRLAEEGAVFDNFLVTTSLCSPSRASILTGTYAHRHGVRYNEVSDPDPSLPQFPQVLQEHGYVTAMIGKWHMARHAEPRDGFDYWLSFEGQGVYTDPELNEDGRVCRVEGYITDILTDKTIEFLKAETDRPFSILLWHKANHAPFEPAPRHADAFPDAEIDEAVSRSLDFSGKPRWQRRERIYGPHYRHWIASEGKPIPDRLDPPPPWHARNHVILNMLRCMLAVDEGLGRIMDLLEQQDRLDDTIIIFMADNGWFHGEHRRGDKRLAYEESIRVPFAIRFPESIRGGIRIDGWAANIDIAPTLLQMAGAEIPESIQGESFVKMLEDPGFQRSEPFFYQYFQEEYAPGIPTMLAVRTAEWKYIHYPYECEEEGNFDELYNLEDDPLEMENLIHSPEAAYRLSEMRELLNAAMEKYDYTEPPYRYTPPSER